MTAQPSIPAEDFGARVPALQERVEVTLARYLRGSDGSPPRLMQAMRYSVLGQGKRLRPLLVYASGAVADIPANRLDAIAAAIELVHAYSLVHDDLPAMDDDDLRRGRATTHIAYDEATAILVGDAMQALAFEVLAADPCFDNAADISCKLIEYLAKASGPSGMAGGQALDLAAAGQAVSAAQLDDMYARKTGRLIRAAVQMPLLCDTRLPNGWLEATDAYAACIGLAFQVKDDLIEAEGTTDRIGKPQDSDVRNAKPTYPALLGVPASRDKLQQLHSEAIAHLEPLGARADALCWLANHIVTRDA